MVSRTASPGSLLAGTIAVMEELHRSAESIFDTFQDFFDPLNSDHIPMLCYLAHWFDMNLMATYAARESSDDNEDSQLKKIRALQNCVKNGVWLYKKRGSMEGIVAYLELATGKKGFVIEEEIKDHAGAALPFHFNVYPPSGCEPMRTLIEEIIELQKPVQCTYSVIYTP